jgi:hypothetical protein
VSVDKIAEPRFDQELHERRMSRLPRWARDLIARQRAEIERLDLTARAATAFPDSDTYTEDWRAGDRLNLPPGARVRFVLGPVFDQYLEARIEKDRLVVHGGVPFVVQPRSSNGAEIILKERGAW